jgi:trimeric autotransporter adhesin
MRFSFTKIILFFAITCCSSHIALAQPGNDACANARLISTDTACVSGTSSLTGQTLTGATANTTECNAFSSSCSFLNTARDVWYKFVAKTKTPTIIVSNVSGWGGITNVKVQLLSSTCGFFSEVACASGVSGTADTLTPTLFNALTEGTTYYIRVHRNTTVVVPAGFTFDICVTDALTKASRMNEIFSRTILSDANVLQYPWEVTYGPDNNLWITESKGYKVYKMNPNTGAKTTVLDISQGSTFLPLADRIFNCQFANGTGAQGGLAGLALHPNFLDGTGSENNSVYISYIYSSNGGTSPTGLFFTNRLVKFNYNKVSGKLESPVSLCDTLPGSSDHNSQRMIIAPVTPGGTKYLFYGQGDMGSGQFGNRTRPQKAQVISSYEGKILRFNLVSDGDAGLNAWLPNAPNANPYVATSAVYSIGIRNNQGFAYDTALNILYGSSHGPYSDDEINIIKPFKNYGHPMVIGYEEGNYDGDTTVANTRISAGADFLSSGGVSSCAPIGNEVAQMNLLNASAATKGAFQHPIFSAYPSPKDTITKIWKSPGSNTNWYSEGWSGLDIYSNKIIPGWNKSLVAAGLKWGRLLRLPLSSSGITTMPSNKDSANVSDTITYFQSTNRYRDLAFAPNGKDMFIVMDNNSATSGPGTANPTTPACPGCVIKYSFLGYADAAGLSAIPKTIAVDTGKVNICNAGTTVIIDGSNNFLWVPITGPDGNIIAEINANGNNLDTVTSSFYRNGGAIRAQGGVRYLDRNINIKPKVQPTTAVKIRLYFTKQELNALITASGGTIDSSSLKILKNNDPCSAALLSSTGLPLTPTNTGINLQHGANGYVLQTAVSSFSTFYFAANSIVLPVDLLTFSGTLQSNLSTLLTWKTENELNTARFELERSIDGNNFNQIASLKAAGNSNSILNYSYTDNDAIEQQTNTIYYRLKIINTDGSFKYSNIITISLPITKVVITIAPNPVVNDVKGNIISPIAGNVTLRIFDNAGRMVLQTNVFVKKGSNNFTQNIIQLAKGAYYLDISGNGIISRSKFQKL